MAGLCWLLLLLGATSSVVHGHENISTVAKHMSLLEEELNDLKSDIVRMELRMMNKIDVLKLVLRSDLAENIVPSYMSSLFESFDATVNSHVISQIRRLKHGYQQVKRQTLSLTKQLSEIGMTKSGQEVDIVMVKGECEHQVSQLRTELNLTRRHVWLVEEEVTLLKGHMTALIRQVGDLQAQMNETLRTVQSLVQQNERLRNDPTATGITQPVPLYTSKTPTSPNSTPVATTPTTRMFHNMTRLLVVQYLSISKQYPHEITINKHDMRTYPYLHESWIEAVTYDPVSRTLIFSRLLPSGMYTSKLDVSGVRTLKKGIGSFGLTVDVDRRVIFFTTYHPSKSISRMSTSGRRYRILVDLSRRPKKDYPHDLAVCPRTKTIYFGGNRDGLWSVDYNGNRLHQINKRDGVIAVTFDNFHNALYFSVNKTVIQLSLSTNTRTEVSQFNARIKDLVYHDNKVFMSGQPGADIAVVDLDNNVYTTVKTMNSTYNVMCLIP
ncbi:uncharacterized protein [Haliotis asinina]|uniref:uncharacterized protein n=1 Tax=Haliotis asinina TaxID=109174 RepID=UPI003532744D